MRYANPNTDGAKVNFKSQYENFIGGEWVAPVKGEYFDDISPVDGKVFTKVADSTSEDVELALDAAHKAKDAWAKTSPMERSNVLLKIADRLDEHLELLAVAETWENGKPVRETLEADIPLAIDHFRYFAGCIRAQRVASVRLTMIRLLIIITNHWVWLGKSFLGTFPFLWQRGKSPLHWQRATVSC